MKYFRVGSGPELEVGSTGFGSGSGLLFGVFLLSGRSGRVQTSQDLVKSWKSGRV